MHTFPAQAVTGTYRSPLGPMTLLATSDALIGAWFEGQQHFPALGGFSKGVHHAVLAQACDELDAYFSKKSNTFSVRLEWPGGTAFQQSVWQSLRQITCGATSTYGAIAQAIGKPNAVRAVGGAIGRNPLSIFVPCHRVIGSQGQLTGYAGGMERKVALLRREGAL